ncbi:peptidoglycan-binding protein [Nocardioides sp. Root1257]|uniref:CIS tube protein n=1 Tax=unclassified Nocardioides TaxID=2615069 RepID=UPI0006FD06FA|nr:MULTISPECIES: LysM peptidoglycan-binding domain-containing protein [unclassified Nocardioides]KQW45975.1 peptidoglycan-binding protein [Nocardioides sp. Root1257]KRC43239.1 peptidoglycan-binding protein [Nocardioides sp. Root224]
MAELEKAFLEIEGSNDKVPCLYNPETVTVGRRNNWVSNPMPGQGVPTLRYAGATSGWLKVDLVFDTTKDGTAVTAHTGKIVDLMDVDPSLPGADEATSNVRPPTVTFHWGDLHSFKAVIEGLRLSFTYFSSAGVPLRANMELELRQYEKSQAFGAQNPTSGTPKPHRVHRVQPGETLDRISARYYGDSTRWRLLASANGLEDPLAVRPGTMLTVPRLEGS